MPSRRSHTKSHHGCRQCKARRVKCDETAPQCQRCVKRHITCSFITDGNDGFIEATTPTQSQMMPTPIADHYAPNPQPPNANGYHTTDVAVHPRLDLGQPSIYQLPVPSISPVPIPVSPPPKVWDLLDLELIHQYCTRTYMSISSRLSTHAVWRDKVFKEGLRHGFLMEGILAVAALHKASHFNDNSPEYRRYAEAAIMHQNAALREYSPLMVSPTPDNATALFSLSMLLTLTTFALERLPDDMKAAGTSYLGTTDATLGIDLPFRSSTRSFIMVISTLRGILTVIHQTQQYFEGDIAEFMRYPKTEDLPPHSADVTEMYEQLADTAARYRSEDTRIGISPEALADLLHTQVIRLRDVTRCRHIVEWDSHIFSFIVSAPAEYIELIKKGEPMALVIFAHWAACFKCMDHHWWAAGWGERLVFDIPDLVDMGAWSRVMEWPLSQVRRHPMDYGPSQGWGS